MAEMMTLREAAIELLRAGGPKHYEKLTEEILAKGLASSSSKTSAASLNVMIAVNAVRGTIIATAPFSKGTAETAFATGAAPITLIDGNKLIDLLIEHGIGVKKNKIGVLSVDADAFADQEPEA